MFPLRGRYDGWSGEGLHVAVSSKENWNPIEHKGEKTDISGLSDDFFVEVVLNRKKG